MTLRRKPRSNIELVQEIGKQEDHIDLLVNNVGISEGKSDVKKGDQNAKALLKPTGRMFTGSTSAVSSRSQRFPPFSTRLLLASHKHTGSIINITSVFGITRTTQHPTSTMFQRRPLFA